MTYKYKPETKEELVEAICTEIFIVQGENGKPNWEADLNCIDVSNISDMRGLFGKNSAAPSLPKHFINTDERRLWHFFGNISKWNVKNVTNFQQMFASEATKRFFPDIGDWEINKDIDKDKAFFWFIGVFDSTNLGMAVFLKENDIDVYDFFGTKVTRYLRYIDDNKRPRLPLPEKIYSLKTLQKAVNIGISYNPHYMLSALKKADWSLKDFFKNPVENELIDEIDYEYALMYISAFYFFEKDLKQKNKFFETEIVKKFNIDGKTLKENFNKLLNLRVSNVFIAKNIDTIKDFAKLDSFEKIYDFFANKEGMDYEERLNFLSIKLKDYLLKTRKKEKNIEKNVLKI